jgi:hypothetical protein
MSFTFCGAESVRPFTEGTVLGGFYVQRSSIFRRILVYVRQKPFPGGDAFFPTDSKSVRIKIIWILIYVR